MSERDNTESILDMIFRSNSPVQIENRRKAELIADKAIAKAIKSSRPSIIWLYLEERRIKQTQPTKWLKFELAADEIIANARNPNQSKK